MRSGQLAKPEMIESTEFLRSVLDSVYEHIVVIDGNGSILLLIAPGSHLGSKTLAKPGQMNGKRSIIWMFVNRPEKGARGSDAARLTVFGR